VFVILEKDRLRRMYQDERTGRETGKKHGKADD
jgi:hypothetical protein